MKQSLKTGLMTILSTMLMMITATSAIAFNETWVWDKCPICGKYFKHMGNDISATPGYRVIFNNDGYYKGKIYDSNWKNAVVITNKTNTKTWVIWHLGTVSSFKVGDSVKGKQIGTVADLTITTDHVHLGQRNAPYNSSLSWKGALPSCSHKPKGLPQAPEYFVAPNNADITITK